MLNHVNKKVFKIEIENFVKRTGAPLWRKNYLDLNVGFTIALAGFYVVFHGQAVS